MGLFRAGRLPGDFPQRAGRGKGGRRCQKAPLMVPGHPRGAGPGPVSGAEGPAPSRRAVSAAGLVIVTSATAPPLGLYSIGTRDLDVTALRTLAAPHQVPFLHLR